MEALVWAMGEGAKKYTPRDYMNVQNGRRVYFAAVMRHLWAWWRGEIFDPKSKVNHLGHAMANCMILMAIHRQPARFIDE